jgi:pyridoxine/pyridoxamine 5'-phosphate oxidase
MLTPLQQANPLPHLTYASVQVCEEVNAIALATADASGRPSVRVVLLKGFDARGFTFYTNYNRWVLQLPRLLWQLDS